MAEVPQGLDNDAAAKYIVATAASKEEAAQRIEALIEERGLKGDPQAEFMRNVAQDYGVKV